MAPMLLKFAFQAVFLNLVLLISWVGSSDGVLSKIKWWCNQTPYPQPCEYFMSHLPPSCTLKDKSDFHKLSIQAALDGAVHAMSHTLSLAGKCRNEREKAAWTDCIELYDGAIVHLNRTLNPSGCTEVDSQTWLSAALTNLETCRTGFLELEAGEYMLPLMSNNVSKLISNSLAVNKIAAAIPQHKNKGGFPAWVTAGDRKLLQASSPAPQANVVVAQDGSGNFKTIKEAVDAASKRKGTGRFIIYVKAGTYKENLVLGKKVKNVMVVGDGIGKTIVTGSKSVGGGTTTFNSATFAVTGANFIAQNMTFRNTAGPSNHQAVALRSNADLSVFYRCSFEGYQDTLYVHSLRQFYRDCDIYGTVDFIFGNAAVVLQNCNIHPRKPMGGQENTITAQGRTDRNQNTGISIINSKVTASSDLKPVQGSVKTFLGRPWKQYSRTVYLETFLDSLIDPAGWLEWSGKFALSTLYYGEYKNPGPGSSTAKRVKWGGYHVITDPTEASQFTAGNFISAGSWLPSTGVPFTSGL